MTRGEKIYTALTVVITLFVLLAIGTWITMILPKMETPQSGKLVIFLLCVLFLTLAVTSGVNIAKGRLLLIPTIVQAIFLLMTGYGIPLAVMAYILLRRGAKKAKTCQQEDEPELSG